MEYRRRVQHQAAAWSGFCHIDGDAPAMWRDCEVVDVSLFGLDLTFIHPRPWELMQRRIVVDVSTIGNALTLRLEGEVRDAAFTLEGDIRVGVELVGLTPDELALTAALSGISRNRVSRPTADLVP